MSKLKIKIIKILLFIFFIIISSLLISYTFIEVMKIDMNIDIKNNS